MAVIGVVACCDTKYHEIIFVREKIEASGNQPLVLDISTGPYIPIRADVTREEVLELGGYTWEQVHSFDKSGAISAMTESISKMLVKLYKEKKIEYSVCRWFSSLEMKFFCRRYSGGRNGKVGNS